MHRTPADVFSDVVTMGLWWGSSVRARWNLAPKLKIHRAATCAVLSNKRHGCPAGVWPVFGRVQWKSHRWLIGTSSAGQCDWAISPVCKPAFLGSLVLGSYLCKQLTASSHGWDVRDNWMRFCQGESLLLLMELFLHRTIFKVGQMEHSVKSFYFVGTKLHCLMMIDMFVDTWICGFSK